MDAQTQCVSGYYFTFVHDGNNARFKHTTWWRILLVAHCLFAVTDTRPTPNLSVPCKIYQPHY